MTTPRKRPSRPTTAAKPVQFASVGADYSRDIAMIRERARTQDKSPEAALARLKASGLIVKNGVLRVDTSK